MRKLITGLVMASAISGFAQTENLRSITIEDITYGKSMTISCVNAECDYLYMKTDDTYGYYKNPIGNRIISRTSMMETIKNRRGYENNEKFYTLSDDTVKNIKRNVKEGYTGSAIGNSVLLVGAGVVDTAIVLPKLIIQALTPKKDSKNLQRGAKRINNNLESDIETVRVKHKYYMQMRGYITESGGEYFGEPNNNDLYVCKAVEHASVDCNGNDYYRTHFYVFAKDDYSAEKLCFSNIKYDSKYEKFCGYKRVK